MDPVTADRLLLCVCWLVYLLALFASNGLGSYLAPWQHPLVYAAGAVFALLTALSWWGGSAPNTETDATHQHPRHQPTDVLLQTLVHCLPIFLIAGLGVTTLGNQALSTDGFSAPRQRVTTVGDPSKPAAATPTAPDQVQESTLSELYASDTPPHLVSLIAMAYSPTAADQHRLPAAWHDIHIAMLLYRFEVTCCAADASPIYAILSGVEPAAYPNGTWLRVTGSVTPPKEPVNLATITVSKIERVPEPLDPYLVRAMNWPMPTATPPASP